MKIVLHNLQEILVITICAVLANNDNFEDIVLWARAKQAWLRTFLTLKNGIPAEDTFLRIFRLLDPSELEVVFRQWVCEILPALDNMIAIDGKTSRGSGCAGEQAIHRVSAFATQSGLVLGQEKTCEKSNEITAIPTLRKTMDLKGTLISMDAMGCQKDIAALIRERQGDYLLAVKANQPSLLAAINPAFMDSQPLEPSFGAVDRTHGRTVIQNTRVLPAQNVVNLEHWPDCKVIAAIDSYRKIRDEEPQWERRDYVSSQALLAEQLAVAVKSHWGIENRLHWVLDVVFREDASTLRKQNAPQNLSLIRKIAINLT